MSQRLTVIRSSAAFDHGAALRVPAPHDEASWRKLMAWLGECGREVGSGQVSVDTAGGPTLAGPGDWIVLSFTGEFHVTVSGGARWDA
jgi:hypothetical protein